MENNITQHAVAMFNINNLHDFMAGAITRRLMEDYYSQLNGALYLARSLDIISIEEYISISNDVSNTMANKIVKEGWC